MSAASSSSNVSEAAGLCARATAGRASAAARRTFQTRSAARPHSACSSAAASSASAAAAAATPSCLATTCACVLAMFWYATSHCCSSPCQDDQQTRISGQGATSRTRLSLSCCKSSTARRQRWAVRLPEGKRAAVPAAAHAAAALRSPSAPPPTCSSAADVNRSCASSDNTGSIPAKAGVAAFCTCASGNDPSAIILHAGDITCLMNALLRATACPAIHLTTRLLISRREELGYFKAHVLPGAGNMQTVFAQPSCACDIAELAV